MESSTIEQLDIILNYCYESKDAVKAYEIQKHFQITEKIFLTLNQEDFKLILDKLTNDGYVVHHHGLDEYYIISWNGKFFKENGGYKQRREKNRIELWYQNMTTFSLIFGGVAAGIYYIYQLFHILFPCVL